VEVVLGFPQGYLKAVNINRCAYLLLSVVLVEYDKRQEKHQALWVGYSLSRQKVCHKTTKKKTLISDGFWANNIYEMANFPVERPLV